MDKQYIDLLKKLKKEEILKIVNLFHQYCLFYDYPIAEEINKEKKENIISYLMDKLDVYVKFVISSIDYKELEKLKKTKDYNLELFKKNYLIINDTLSSDIKKLISQYLKNKSVNKKIKENKEIYLLARGIMTCYGALPLSLFKTLIGEKEYLLISINNDNLYKIEDDKIYINKITNKRKINKYIKNNDLKKYSKNAYLKLGNNTYHHTFTTYKKLIRVLKNNYLFKNKDINFLDEKIVIPYLYNNTKDEDMALNNLDEAILKYFEFGNSKLKEKIISSLKLVREEFPLWEYRGRSIKEEKND